VPEEEEEEEEDIYSCYTEESKNAVGRCNVPVTLSCMISSFYCNLLIYSHVQVFCHFMND
jgi:hypothetical protein